jgi:hypothetical protein
MALTTWSSALVSEAAMSPWGSGRNQLTVAPTFTPSRSPAGSTRLSVVVVTPAVRLLSLATVSLVPT